MSVELVQAYEVKNTLPIISSIWAGWLGRGYHQTRQTGSPFFFYDLQLREVSRLVSL
ncbi:hypothetical protein VoSk93_21050 [Vibrio owensii]